MRLLNRFFAALLSLALVAAGALLFIEVVANRINHKPAVVKWHGAYDWAARTQWQQGSVRVVCIALAAAGLLLLIFELKRPRVTRLKISADGDDGPGIDAAYTRRGVAAAVQTAVTDVDGVRSAQVTVKGRKVTVVAGTSARDDAAAGQLLEPARSAALERLAALDLLRNPKLKISTTARKR
ncbi:MAG: DUF6286 domain-containing protein [Actinomycetota bacterium]